MIDGKVQACENCAYAVFAYPYIRCRRYPEMLEVEMNHWCYEWALARDNIPKDNKNPFYWADFKAPSRERVP